MHAFPDGHPCMPVLSLIHILTKIDITMYHQLTHLLPPAPTQQENVQIPELLSHCCVFVLGLCSRHPELCQYLVCDGRLHEWVWRVQVRKRGRKVGCSHGGGCQGREAVLNEKLCLFPLPYSCVCKVILPSFMSPFSWSAPNSLLPAYYVASSVAVVGRVPGLACVEWGPWAQRIQHRSPYLHSQRQVQQPPGSTCFIKACSVELTPLVH